MPRTLISETRRKKFAISTIALMVLGVSSASSVKAQAKARTFVPTTWTITLDATANPSTHNPRPAYTVAFSPASGGCPYKNPDPKNLKVCQGDTVKWTATTTHAHGHMYIYHEDLILTDSLTGKLARGFHGDPTDNLGGKVSSDKSLLGPHEYYVAVFDSDNGNRLYIDDPRIIIGTGNRPPKK